MMISAWDVPILIVLGMIVARIYAKWLAIKHPDFFAHAGFWVVALFWLSAVISAFGAHPWFGTTGGYEVPGWIALFYVLSYPLWYLFGAERAFAIFGRRPTQGGFLWPFTIEDKTKPFESPWKGSGTD